MSIGRVRKWLLMDCLLHKRTLITKRARVAVIILLRRESFVLDEKQKLCLGIDEENIAVVQKES